MKSRRRRHKPFHSGSNSVTRKPKSRAILCSMNCAKEASTVCAACERPLCKDHTTRIPFGPNPDDTLTLELCQDCSTRRNLGNE